MPRLAHASHAINKPGRVLVKHTQIANGGKTMTDTAVMPCEYRTKSKELRMAIGARLRAARRAYEPVQTTFAHVMGVSPQGLSAFEFGRNYPAERFLVEFCNRVGCPTDWLFLGARGMQVASNPQLINAILREFPEVIVSSAPEDTGYPPLRGDDRHQAEMVFRSTLARRLYATRWCHEQRGSIAAAALGIQEKTLYAYEIARNYPDEAFLVRFSAWAGVTLDWIYRGRPSSTMSREMSSRIAMLAPELVEDLTPATQPRKRAVVQPTEQERGSTTWDMACVGA